MTLTERKAVFSLSLIMTLRMLGLFMVIPIFSLYATRLVGATPLLVGIAMGIYGLSQGLLQIPFGMWSDHMDRKKVIALGLALFALGSIIAALTHTITGMIIARILQGAGAVGSTMMALVADFTRESERTKAMALMGMTIGLAFTLAFILGPLLNGWIQVNGIFWLTTGFAILAILLLFTVVPKSPAPVWHADTEPVFNSLFSIFIHKKLLGLNIGIFILHAVLTASFVAIPLSLHYMTGVISQRQWLLYLPILVLAFGLTIPCIIIAEKKRLLKKCFLLAISFLVLAEWLLWNFSGNVAGVAISLLLFFTGFSILEAFLPSLVSRIAPPARKGTALGVYSSAQFLGIFMGGLLGGWIYGQWGLATVYLFCLILLIIWMVIALYTPDPQHQ